MAKMRSTRLRPQAGCHSFVTSIIFASIYVPTVFLLCGSTTAISTGFTTDEAAQQIVIAGDNQQIPIMGVGPMAGFDQLEDDQKPLPEEPGLDPPALYPSRTLRVMLDTLDVMQSKYFVLWQATWPTGIDWTKAVANTHISSVLSLLSSTLDATASIGLAKDRCDDKSLSRVNLINYYFQQTSAFWYGEDFFGIRLQAYDDMLWVVLEWLESIKFQNLHSELHFGVHPDVKAGPYHSWHGTQYKKLAAHRSRVFYDLALRGWDTLLCGGGMIWSPWLAPYKNAITNELFISASVDMYLYFPGDTIDSPIVTNQPNDGFVSPPHNALHLEAAITAYEWLKNSNMTGPDGLYGDGFHIRGWTPTNPGSSKCDDLNTMVYTYNQGVILSGLRGLWLATGVKSYLEDGHGLVQNVMKATGWPDKLNNTWHGLGRGGVLEEACDSTGLCSQDGQTFKGIYFHHFAEFCRQLSPQEKRMLSNPNLRGSVQGQDGEEGLEQTFEWHQKTCSSYLHWLRHNSKAAAMTKNPKGQYGMWWGRKYAETEPSLDATVVLPHGAVDYSNNDPPWNGASPDFVLQQAKRNRTGFVDDGVGSTVGSQLLVPITNADPSPQLENGDGVTDQVADKVPQDVNDRGRGRTLETQSGALAVFKALYQWETTPSLRQ